MTIDSILKQPEIAQILVATITAISVLLGVLITSIVQHYGNKSRSTHELNIKRIESEIRRQDNIQAFQLEALKELWKIYQRTLPNVWSHPDYEHEDALCNVLQSMNILIPQLNDYLREFGYILPDQVNNKISFVICQCNQSHWGISTSDDPGYEPSKQELESASEVLRALSDGVSLLKAYLDVTKLAHPMN